MFEIITSLQAYKAMICLLDNYYNEKLSDDLGSLLGDLQLLEDDNPSDPAAWSDWMHVLGNHTLITISEAFKGIIKFLDDYSVRTSSKEIKDILHVLEQAYLERPENIVWNNWIECINKSVKIK